MDVLGYQDLAQRLNTGRPLLMLDRAVICEPGVKAQAVKAVTMDEAFFQGHFPGAPIMPGVLQVAAMSQAAGLLLPAAPSADSLIWLAGVQKIKFRKPVLPGDFLQVEAVFESRDEASGDYVFRTQSSVDGEVTCQGLVRLAWKPRAAFARPLGDLEPVSRGGGAQAAGEQKLKIEEIMAVIPHRFPFLLIDRVLHMDIPAQHLSGVKNISGNEPYMAAHPVPFAPGFLQIEMAAQVGCVLALSIPENKGKLGFFMAIDDAKFHAPVMPGDQLVIETNANMRSKFGKGDAKIYVGDQLVTEVLIKFAIVDRDAVATEGGAA